MDCDFEFRKFQQRSWDEDRIKCQNIFLKNGYSEYIVTKTIMIDGKTATVRSFLYDDVDRAVAAFNIPLNHQIM